MPQSGYMQLVNRRDSPVTGCSLGPYGGGCGGEVGGVMEVEGRWGEWWKALRPSSVIFSSLWLTLIRLHSREREAGSLLSQLLKRPLIESKSLRGPRPLWYFLIILRQIQCLSTFGTILMLLPSTLHVWVRHVGRSSSSQSAGTVQLPSESHVPSHNNLKTPARALGSALH